MWLILVGCSRSGGRLLSRVRTYALDYLGIQSHGNNLLYFCTSVTHHGYSRLMYRDIVVTLRIQSTSTRRYFLKPNTTINFQFYIVKTLKYIVTHPRLVEAAIQAHYKLYRWYLIWSVGSAVKLCPHLQQQQNPLFGMLRLGPDVFLFALMFHLVLANLLESSGSALD